MFTKTEFRKNQSEQDPTKIKQLIESANEAANIIRRNIVQGVKADNKEDVYSESIVRLIKLIAFKELRITKDTEVNDNDSIKIASQQWKTKKASRTTGRMNADFKCRSEK